MYWQKPNAWDKVLAWKEMLAKSEMRLAGTINSPIYTFVALKAGQYFLF